jgi:bacterial/archaeal transporter family protein
MWIVFALLAALSAAIVTVLSKAGLKNIDSSLAFAIESVLIIIVSWAVVLAQKTTVQFSKIAGKEWWFLIIAGVVTALSSLFTFRALKLGNASAVSPLERTSLIFAVIFAAVFLKEKITWQIVVGALLMAGGALLIAFAKKSGS